MSDRTTNNHYAGYFFNEKISTNSYYYRTERKRMHKIVDSLECIKAIEFLEDFIKVKRQKFLKKYPDLNHKLLQESPDLFFEENDTDSEECSQASFLIFLEELKWDKNILFLYQYDDLFWLKSNLDLLSLYKILHKNNVISVNFNGFCLFFALKRDLVFNLNQVNLTVLFKKLVELSCLSEFTVLSMLDNGFIKRKTNEYDKFISLKRKDYQTNKSRKNSNDAKVLDDSMQSLISELENKLK